MPMSRTLVDVAADRARTQADRLAFVHADGGQTAELTYGTLWHRATAVAAAVQRRSAPGDRIAIVSR